MIKNVIFDIGMVLVDFRWRGFLMDRGVSEEDAEYIGSKTMLAPIWSGMDLGARTEQEIIADMKKEIPGYEDKFQLMFDDMTELVRPFPGNREWMKSLKSKGMKIYLLSNYPHDMFEHHARYSFDFMDLVDGRIVSSFVKMVKPNADIYECLLKTYGLKAEECVFLDDRAENVDAAIKLGLKGIVVKNREQAVDTLATLLSEN